MRHFNKGGSMNLNQDQKGEKAAPSKPSVSVAVLALNEAGNLENAVKEVKNALARESLAEYEIIIIDGGSTDATPEIADQLAKEDPKIRVKHTESRGIGYGFRVAAELAKKEYFGWFPGDNETMPETIRNVFSALGKTDVIIPYTVNPWVRPIGRRILSFVYRKICNILFGIPIKYFNGPCFFRRSVLQSITMSADNPAYMTEILVQLLKLRRASYLEVPMYIKARDYGSPKVLKWKNVWAIAKTFATLFFKVRFKKRD